DGVVIRKRPERQIETERGGNHREGLIRDMRRLSALDPADFGARKPDRRAELLLSQRILDPSFSKLVADGQQRAACQAEPAVEPALSDRHRRSMTVVPARAV